MVVEQAGVVVVGGGPAGAAVAIWLHRSGYPVTLLEKAHLPRPKPCGESLSPGAVPLLADLGVLDELQAGPHGEKDGFTIFPYSGDAFSGTYAARGTGVAGRSTGLSIPRLILDHVLLTAARRQGVVVREGWAVREVGAWNGQTRIVAGRDAAGAPFALQAPLLIAADGVHSTVARRLDLARPSQHLQQVAIVTHMQGVRDLGRYGEMHVAPGGYCGIAPLYGGLANVAMVLPAPGQRHRRSPARALRTHQEGIAGFFRDTLAGYPHIGGRLDEARIVGGPWVTSGLACSVRRRIDDGLLLIGDAGGYYDPFTGEGIYRALRSAAMAARSASVALDRGDTRARRLRRYARAYRREFAPKHLVELIVHEVTVRGPLFEHVARRLRLRHSLADMLVGVTGDFRSPYEVLNPWYLARLFV